MVDQLLENHWKRHQQRWCCCSCYLSVTHLLLWGRAPHHCCPGSCPGRCIRSFGPHSGHCDTWNGSRSRRAGCLMGLEERLRFKFGTEVAKFSGTFFLLKHWKLAGEIFTRSRKLKIAGASGDFHQKDAAKTWAEKKSGNQVQQVLSESELSCEKMQTITQRWRVWERGAKLRHKGDIMLVIVKRRRPRIWPDNGESLAWRTILTGGEKKGPRSWKDKLYKPDNGGGVLSSQLCLYCVQRCAHFY